MRANENMSLISDAELRRQLQDNGVDVGPINDSTRGVYQRKLVSLKGKHNRPKTSKSKAPLQSASPKPRVQASTAGVKRQRAAKRAPVRQVEPITSKKPRPADSICKVSPHLELPKKLVLNKELKLYPDLSEYSPDQPLDNHSPIALSIPKPLASHDIFPFQPQHATPKPNPSAICGFQSSPSRVQPSFHNHPSSNFPCSSQSSDDSPFSIDSPHFSKSSIPEVITPESPILLPEPKEKGLLKVVTGFFGSHVSRLLNVSGSSFGSPRRKLSDENGSSSNSFNHASSDNPIGLADIEEDMEEDGRIADLDTPGSASTGASKRYDWELESSEVVLCKRKDGKLWRLGKGGFGVVFKGLKDAIDEVAVKRIPLEKHHHSVIEQFKQEIDMISKLRHRHIVQFYGACIQPQNCYMVTELMDNDLFSVLRLPREAEQYRWSGVYGKETLIGVASGLHYLHSRKPPVVHRDIKSPNILVMAGLAKIADVGIARTMGNSDMTAQKGFSMAWASPEVIYRRRATEKIDIWGLGIVIWEVASGRLPRPGKLMLPDNFPPYLSTLYLHCVSDDPTRRPSALEVTAELRSLT